MIDEIRIKKLASTVILGLSRYIPMKESESVELLKTIEWFSAVAVDDWPVNDARKFPQELNNLIVVSFLEYSFKDSFREFVSEISGDYESIITTQLFLFNRLEEQSKEAYVAKGIRLGYLSYANGILNKYLGNIFVLR